jgi:hypothetical protein
VPTARHFEQEENMKPWIRCGAVGFFIVVSSTANAELKHYAFTGTITGLSDVQGYLTPLGIGNSDTVSGRFSYDADAVLSVQTATYGADLITGSIEITINSGTDTYYAHVDDTVYAQKWDNDPVAADNLDFQRDGGIFDPEIAGTYTASPNQILEVWFYDPSLEAFTDATNLPDSLNLTAFAGSFVVQASLGNDKEQTGIYQISGTMHTLTEIPELTFENGFETE